MVPASDFLFAAHSALFGGVLAQEVEGQVPEGGEVGGGVAGAHAAGIFAQGDVERPVPGVFEAPVAADGAGWKRGLGKSEIRGRANFLKSRNDLTNPGRVRNLCAEVSHWLPKLLSLFRSGGPDWDRLLYFVPRRELFIAEDC